MTVHSLKSEEFFLSYNNLWMLLSQNSYTKFVELCQLCCKDVNFTNKVSNSNIKIGFWLKIYFIEWKHFYRSLLYRKIHFLIYSKKCFFCKTFLISKKKKNLHSSTYIEMIHNPECRWLCLSTCPSHVWRYVKAQI